MLFMLSKCAILLYFVVLSANAQQWNWNPFEPWGNLDLLNPMHKRMTAAEMYGTAGTRNANQKLRSCCRSLIKADTHCKRKYCDFDKIASTQVMLFLTECVVKGPTVGQMWDCVSSKADHTECCRQQGVLPMCMPYCETTKSVPTDIAKYGICIGQFDKIRHCFRSYLDTHPNLNGES